MAIYIGEADIQATMTAAKFTELTTEDAAKTFALDTANADIKSIIGTEYAAPANVPDNIKKTGALLGRYWLHSFHGVLDKDHPFYLDYVNALKTLKEIAAGLLSGANNPNDEDDVFIKSKSNDRKFNPDIWSG